MFKPLAQSFDWLLSMTLARLIRLASTDATFYRKLKRDVAARRGMVAPQVEARALRAAMS